MSEREGRLEREADAALNLSRTLRNQLRRQARADSPKGASRHAWLDTIQGWTPGFARAAVRPLYLNLFYRRFFPEPSAGAPQAVEDGLAAWSGYAPFLDFKQQLCRGLNTDRGGFGCECRSGLVSVVLPVYNGSRYLAESIESVLRQTYASLELIVVDDGSTDSTPEVASHYLTDPRVRLIRQENRKLPGALNTGFAQAEGEFFTWTSADNRMRSAMLAELVAFLRGNADAEMAYADEELIDEQGAPAQGANFCRNYQTPPGSNQLARPRDPGELSFIPNNYVGGCFLYRAWAARAVGGYDPKRFGFEDYDYWLRMNALFRIAHLGKRMALYSYRLHPGSLTAREKELRIAERTRHAFAGEEERRRFYAGSFDITFAGSHPWFPPLARAYRRAGHNVFELQRNGEEDRYRHRVTRAFSKSITVTDGTADATASDFAALQGNRLLAAGKEWRAEDASALEYPLLAIANAALFS